MRNPRHLTIVLLLIPAIALAGPQVTAVDGPVADGATVTVLGLDFGTKSPAAPVLFDHVVDQAVYGALAEGDPIPTRTGGCPDCPWERNLPYGGGVRYTVQNVRTAGGAAYRAAGAGYLALADLGDLAPDRLLVNWWVRAVDALDPDVAHQLIRVRADPDDLESGVVTWSQRSLVRSVNENEQSTLWRDWGGEPGVWYDLELQVDSRDEVTLGLGRVQALVDGDPIHTADFWAAAPLNDLVVLGLKLLPPDPIPAPELTFTDIYVDTTFARVFLCDTSDAAPGSHCELQRPETWSDTSLTISCVTGTFAAGDTVYLFVVDADGERSGGYPVTIVELLDDDLPPGAPESPKMGWE